ncbi:hypothetical protein ABPG75_007855 [Micractinium tetrahymenae]
MLRQAVAVLCRPRLGPLLLLILHVTALALFVHGFLLTRVHLPQRSSAPPTAAASPPLPPYDRVVWLMMDALRYDFVVFDGRYRCPPGAAVCHQGHMPYLSSLAARTDAARSFMFVADAPTTTTQRLKALATGGLPSFFDVSNSFTAGALDEDNLLGQLAGAGRRMAFLGDTTWAQLFPRQWAWSRPFPCFNVKDLHTVDDGVWEHLLPALRAPASWDGLLVAHYLGVDHCGHTHGVGSAEMAAKLRQMDDHVQQVVAALLEQAGPGGAYERTLLLVSGDHGQTLGGDHGGGSPEEVDSALVGVDIGALRASLAGQAGQQADGQGAEAAGSGASGAASSASSRAAAGLAAPAPCRANCSCGVERNQCAPDLLQMDLAPTLAAMLGVPIPFGNLGRLSAELWQLTLPQHGGSATAATAWERSLADALLANARQVHAYLNAYAATAGTSFSRAALAALNAQFDELEDAASDAAASVARCQRFLGEAAAVAREQWTQFGDTSMVAGLVLFAAVLVLQAAAAFRGAVTGSAPAGVCANNSKAVGPAEGAQKGGGWLAALGGWRLLARVGRWRLPVPAFRAWLAAVLLVHGLGIFSFFYLLSEGRMVCFLVAAVCLALALSVGRATWVAGQRLRGVVAMGIMSLRCNALMAVLGVAHHTGQGFWVRLTVHEPQPADDLERGWHGKLGKAKALATALMAAAGVDRLPPAVLLAAQHSLLCTLPIMALAAATERLQRGSRRGVLQRLLVLAAFASVAAYLHVEDAIKHGLLPKGLTLHRLAGQHLRPLLPAQLAAWLEAAGTAAQPALAAVPAAARLGARLLALPLMSLLPHVTYALCAALAVIWLAQAASRRLQGAAAATAAAQLLLAALLQVSDRQAPLILLLALLEITAVARLLARRAELLPAGTAAGVAGEVGALLALVAAQLFYSTGHLCEFAGLQYTAGFVGSEEFHLWRSGSLMALNTFGGMLLPLLALPAVVQYVEAATAAKPMPDAGTAEQGGRGQDGQQLAASTAAAAGQQDSPGTMLRQAIAVAGLAQAAAAFCATLSAGMQRRHLYAWALFAPRFSFAAVKLVLSDLALLLLSLLA